MEKNIYILGHKNPDTDSVCSALAYAWLRNHREGTHRYLAGRLGPISSETEHVLRRFGFSAPPLIDNVRAQVQDLDLKEIPPVPEELSLHLAWETMRSKEITTLCVSGDGMLLDGLVTIGDLARSYLEPMDNRCLSKGKTPVSNLREVLQGELLSGDPDGILSAGRMLVGAMQPETMEDYVEPGDGILLGDREDSQIRALRCGAGLLILTGGLHPSEEVLRMAGEAGCTVLSTPYDTFVAANLVNQSLPVSALMKKDTLTTFEPEDYIEEIKDTMTAKRYRNFPVVDGEGRYRGMISRALLLNLKRKKVILVDHNERAQSVDGLEESEILEIIDHHRIGDIQTAGPVLFRNMPVGCTATLIAQIYREQGTQPEPDIAGILCCAILSDTLNLKSPTCTDADRNAVAWLEGLAGICAMEEGMAMFRAGSDLRTKTPRELFLRDFKRVNNGRDVLGIGQINSPDRQELLWAKDSIQSEMKQELAGGQYDFLLFLLTDITAEESILLFEGDCRELLENTFHRQATDGSMLLPGVLSRKKQVVPPLLNALGQRKK